MVVAKALADLRTLRMKERRGYQRRLADINGSPCRDAREGKKERREGIKEGRVSSSEVNEQRSKGERDRGHYYYLSLAKRVPFFIE